MRTHARALRFSTCLKITRTDRTIHRFTDHQSPLDVDGETYSPVGGFSVAAREKSLREPANTVLTGALRSGLIEYADLLAGRYRQAVIEEFTVDWRYPWAGNFYTTVFVVESASFNGEQVEVRVAGKSIRLRSSVGDFYSRQCRWRVFDDDCGVNPAGFVVSGEVVSVVEDRRIFTTDLATGNADGYYNDGKLTWTSGANSGGFSEVKVYELTDGRLELHSKTPRVVTAGDAFSLLPGCDRLFDSDCKSKYENQVRFGGFPYIIGTDSLMSMPEGRE